ncbi:SWR1 complex bromodomain subunit bdf1-like [Teratosphaeria destructans]|uniref:SWR1 complex bromodomain subunit bdf1-like n=1 Tax=Teratosphaeria destructans TaxID=418781 RepID=A0A9W7SS03_9PEZI|nr:SWR1 complex bromodomain subunit bdf1-like [Teratosphaeria destructans]
MDISTMWQKLRSGQYSKAHEFRKDFELMVENCLTFNPQGNPVRDMGIGLRREFERFWKEKEKWERQHKPDPVRGASASADEESDEDEEDEDPGEDDKARQIKMLQEQLAAMQNVIGGLVVPEKSTKKAKKPKGDKKSKAGGASAVSKARPAPAPAKKKAGGKPKQVTYEEKQEISEAVNRMDEGQVSELTRIITENCVKYRDMEEMELEIDELPNDVQALLLKYVRRLFGRPKSVATYQTPDSPPDAGAEEDDEEYVAERGRHGSMGGGSKRKKHKPMSKQQQTAKMAELQNKLAQFDNAGTSGSMSPSAAAYHQNNAAESSGDDESEESEEE